MLRRLLVAGVLLFSAASASRVDAGSHAWQVNELFSNADGTIQFVEMHECCGSPSEIALSGKWILSETTTNQFDFPADLVAGTTANKHLLLATAGFAALPGAPTPDHIIPDNFFSTDADTIGYWMYAGQGMSFLTDDLPTDGILALQRNGTTTANSPTNFAGDSGSVDASGGITPTPTLIRGDANQSGGVEIADAISALGVLFSGEATTCANALDANDDGGLDIADPVYLLSYLFVGGPAPGAPFPTCGADPTPSLTCAAFTACP